MAKKHVDYYDLDEVVSSEIQDIFSAADKNPFDFIRIMLLPEEMLFFNRSTMKFSIYAAIVIYTDSKGDIHLGLFDKHNDKYSFQCAILPDKFVVFSMDTASGHREKSLFLEGDEQLLILLKTYNSTIAVAYNGQYCHVLHDHVKEYAGYPSLTQMLIEPLFRRRGRLTTLRYTANSEVNNEEKLLSSGYSTEASPAETPLK